jgi:deoxyribodipyrimidine photo-lyase
MKTNIFWFRRDLRLDDNIGLNSALSSGNPVLGIFIFDEDIIENLPKDDARISFIYQKLEEINKRLNTVNSSLLVIKGKPINVFNNLIKEYEIENLYSNLDYEPYAIDRDKKISDLLKKNKIHHLQYKDQVIFGPTEILKENSLPYTVFTAYKNKWLSKFKQESISTEIFLDFSNFFKIKNNFPLLSEIGFLKSKIKVVDFNLESIRNYSSQRDYPFLNAGTSLSVHLRFGTVSIRHVINSIPNNETTFLSELIWREFFMQILFHFPYVVNSNFKKKYDEIQWKNDLKDFQNWCDGKTGYPIVDAGMQELKITGYMHNRARMIVAGFLCKHLLIDWRWGERYFSLKLLDYELSSNNGNWQWAAGTGCDSAPYFRIFNPITQQNRFDKDFIYIKRWIKDFDKENYIESIVEHDFARKRALQAYKLALE